VNEMETGFKISVLTLQGSQLTFRVETYHIGEGGFVCFEDAKDGRTRRFHASRCEIQEVDE